MSKKTFCFDFDGTIADTLPLIVGTLNAVLKKSGEKEITDFFLRKLREEGIEDVFQEINVPLHKLFFLYLRIKKEMNQGVSDVKMKEEMYETLRKLKERNISLGILTSNSKENVKTFLESNNVDFFDFIETSGIFGKTKNIKKLNKKGGLFLYIGDEVRDIKAGKKAGVKTVAVLWGLSSKRALQKAGPDMLIEEPRDLLYLSF